MTRGVFEETLGVLLDRRPFRPFTIALVNGDRFEVDHPRALSLRGGGAVYITPGSAPMIFDNEGVNQIIADLMGQESA